MDLLNVVKRGQEIVSGLMHVGVRPEYTEMTALDKLCDEILHELGEIERYDDVKRAMINMFFFGQISSK